MTLDPSDKTASRKHCEILLRDGAVFVRNLSGSQQGTVLNGRRIGRRKETDAHGAGPEKAAVTLEKGAPGEELVPLYSGDELKLGRHRIRVTY